MKDIRQTVKLSCRIGSGCHVVGDVSNACATVLGVCTDEGVVNAAFPRALMELTNARLRILRA